MTYIKAFFKDLVTGWTRQEILFGSVLFLLQLAVYIWNPASPLSFIAAILGTACVLLIAKGKISNYAFGIVQTAIAAYIAFQASLWGEMLQYLFYFSTQFVGLYLWKKHMAQDVEDDGEHVETKTLTLWQLAGLLVLTALLTVAVATIFYALSDRQPILDAFALIVAIVAQISMLLRYREQWALWFILNCVNATNWFLTGNWSMMALYLAYILNNVYGYIQWTKNAE